jgi:hypothetical protein
MVSTVVLVVEQSAIAEHQVQCQVQELLVKETMVVATVEPQTEALVVVALVLQETLLVVLAVRVEAEALSV